ncbi:MgtC/SapB family protein [Methyloferula stellata]|uniref:MgtC/SapB family protein n=1 Tax=Methyloferula stellata TaxID=876270 RepID=UPI00036526A0|nr:MgtC/SapB family protein [Methyloferula stellata]
MLASPWFRLLIALAIGLLIGLERERSKGEGPHRRPAGIRTFGLTALLGAVAVHVGGTWLLAIVTGAVAILAALSYGREDRGDPGLTTAIGLLATPLLGGLAMSDPPLASALGVTVAVVFAAKAPLHQFVRGVLTDNEMNDGFIFAVVTLVIWPQLPDSYMGPLNSLNPHSLWLLVVLVTAIGAGGHIAIRAFGARYGLPIAGLASGFVSSTATIGAMANRAAKEIAVMAAAVAGAALSTVATFVQMILLLLATSTPVLRVMAPALIAGGLAAALYALAFTLRSLRSSEVPTAEGGGRAFSAAAALGLAATLAVMLVATAYLKTWFGEAGIVIGAAVSGLVDTHSAAISVASLVASGQLGPEAAILPILAAMSSNALMKIVVAISAGSRGFVLRLVPGLILSIAAAWVVAIAIGFK